mgnify:CR=1 FL=1
MNDNEALDELTCPKCGQKYSLYHSMSGHARELRCGSGGFGCGYREPDPECTIVVGGERNNVSPNSSCDLHIGGSIRIAGAIADELAQKSIFQCIECGRTYRVRLLRRSRGLGAVVIRTSPIR